MWVTGQGPSQQAGRQVGSAEGMGGGGGVVREMAEGLGVRYRAGQQGP